MNEKYRPAPQNDDELHARIKTILREKHSLYDEELLVEALAYASRAVAAARGGTRIVDVKANGVKKRPHAYEGIELGLDKCIRCGHGRSDHESQSTELRESVWNAVLAFCQSKMWDGAVSILTANKDKILANISKPEESLITTWRESAEATANPYAAGAFTRCADELAAAIRSHKG